MNKELTPDNITSKLKAVGFVDGDINKDIGSIINGVVYLHRKLNNQYQYISLCSYEGKFLEAVFHVYEQQYNSRQKTPMIPIHSVILREEKDIMDSIEVKYIKQEKKKC